MQNSVLKSLFFFSALTCPIRADAVEFSIEKYVEVPSSVQIVICDEGGFHHAHLLFEILKNKHALTMIANKYEVLSGDSSYSGERDLLIVSTELGAEIGGCAPLSLVEKENLRSAYLEHASWMRGVEQISTDVRDAVDNAWCQNLSSLKVNSSIGLVLIKTSATRNPATCANRMASYFTLD